MATPIDERLIRVIQSKLAAIAAPTYEQTVAATTRASAAPPPMEAQALPALQLRRDGILKEDLLRGVEERVASFRVICIAERSADDEKIADLIADVEKVIKANPRWNDGSVNLARRTWIRESGYHETETDADSPMTGVVEFSVLYRVDAGDPYTLKDI